MMVKSDFPFLRRALRLLAATLLATAAAGALACPGDGGAPCNAAASSPATQPASAAVNVGAGNPINVMTGNKYQREDDMPALPGVLGLEIVRHYNSSFSAASAVPGLAGRGWKLSYETELAVAGDTIRVWQADGSSFMFRRDLVNRALASSSDPAAGSMAIRSSRSGGEEYLWRWADGRELSFDQRGKLVQIKAATGEIASLLYDSKGLLVKVTDPQGRSLQLSYLDRQQAARGDRFRGVQSIASPAGRFSYEYGSAMPKGAAADRLHLLANLVRVRYPSGQGRAYHYEDAVHPTYLTGISIEGQGEDGKPVVQRYASFGYQADGRAVLSTHAGNVDKVTLAYERPGLTVISNSLGQKTSYRYATVADDLRLLEVRGAGCALCGPANERYGYDKLGRLTDVTRLDREGAALESTRMELDFLGRPLRVSRTLFRNGRAAAPQLLVRYEYGSGFGPTLIARPSVVAGKEASLAILYNPQGQPLSVTERGWSPAGDGADQAQPLTRTTRYVYGMAGTRSLLKAIDGPLQNGKSNSPADSDLTLLEYDRGGNHVLAITAPGNLKSTLQYDEAGRIQAVASELGSKTAFRYDAQGRLVQTEHNGRRQSTRFDAAGYPVEIGYGEGKDYQAAVRLGYDDAGRNVWAASPLGMVSRQRYDTEDHVLEASKESGHFKLSTRYAYDEWGRLVSSRDAGGGIRQVGWTSQDLPAFIRDALGRETRYRFDASGNLMEASAAANTLQAQLQDSRTRYESDELGRTTAVIGANGAATRYVRDDFERVVATISADSGATTRVFDEADRLVASADANGNRASYQYDARGRIIKQVITAARGEHGGAAQTVTAWRYQGPYLMEVSHPEQDERYAYDSAGRLAAKTVILKSGGVPVTSVTHYEYDRLGQLASRSLPDGSILEYKRNEQNQIVALERSQVRTAWLRWLLPATPVVEGLERDIVGLRRMEYGNHIQARYQRSKEGKLARIAYQRSGPANALFDQRYQWNEQGNLLHAEGLARSSSYAYDAQDRLIVASDVKRAEPAAARYSRYFYDGAGNRVLEQEDVAQQADMVSGTRQLDYVRAGNQLLSGAQGQATVYDNNGAPLQAGARQYTWDAAGQLLAVSEGTRTLGRYGYNHRGERVRKVSQAGATRYLYEDRQLIAELNGDGEPVRQYIYLAGQPVAVIDRAAGQASLAGERSAMAQVMADLRTIFQAWFSHTEEVAYLHSNHLGAVELATDERGRVIWQASYSPFGKLMHASSGFQFKLRLPGQYEDDETGLYYNDRRYFDPAVGRYLTADPLGLRGGINGYAYVNGNPLKYIDPAGLMLFAFDGTGNSEHPPSGDAISNVLKFYQAYDDQANGKKFYITGIGTTNQDMPYQGNMLNGDGFDQRVALGFRFLDDFVANDTGTDPLDIDVVGFSRGGAEARVWVNQLLSKLSDGKYTSGGKSRCINLRFEGLWDSVPHLGYLNGNESRYDFSIPSAVKYAAQANALNEYRGGGANFNTRSILDNPNQAGSATRVEKGFLGSHADIGGGFGTGDLSDVALMWMLNQAKSQNIKMLDNLVTTKGWDVVTDPVLHDKSSNLINGAPDGGPTASSEDRNMIYGDGTVVKQRQVTSGTMKYSDTVQFINYNPNPLTSNYISGTVDAKAYVRWLQAHGYNLGNLTAQ